jgi:hypothetical protein
VAFGLEYAGDVWPPDCTSARDLFYGTHLNRDTQLIEADDDLLGAIPAALRHIGRVSDDLVVGRIDEIPEDVQFYAVDLGTHFDSRHEFDVPFPCRLRGTCETIDCVVISQRER